MGRQPRNKNLSTLRRGRDTGRYRVADRYGLWLCKDYIPIQRINDWIIGFGTGSNSSIVSQIRERISESLTKLTLWGVRATAICVATLLIASSILEVLHKTDLLKRLLPQELVTECLLVCIFSLGFFAIEQSNRSVEVLESFRNQVNKTITALQEKIAQHQANTEHSLTSMQEKIILEQVNTEHSLIGLRDHQMAAIEIIGFSGIPQFELHWSNLLEAYETLVMWGRFGTAFTKDFKLLQEQGKECSYYMSIEKDTLDVANTFLLCAEESKPGFFKLYETGFVGNLSWIAGFDLRNQRAALVATASDRQGKANTQHPRPSSSSSCTSNDLVGVGIRE